MLRLTFASLRSRPLRAILTALSIVLGVAMISGTFVLTGQIDRAFSEIFNAANAKNDVVIELRTVSENNADGFPQPFPDSVLTTARKVPGVAAATGEIDALGSLVTFKDGTPKRVSSTGGAPPLVFSTSPPRFQSGKYIAGHGARAPGEIALLEDTADKADATIGTEVGLVTLDGLKRLRVVGIYKIGTEASLGGALVSSIPLADAQRWYGFENQFTQVNLQADPGVSHTELRDRVRAAVGARYKVQTGTEKAEADSKGISDLINSFLGPALLAFGGVAVLVGAFLIFNMFSITVAQRIREIAMLRTLGASRRQILTSVMLEAFVTAAVGLDHRHLPGPPDRSRHQRALRCGRIRPPLHRPPARDDGRDPGTRRRLRGDARLGADPGRARDEDPADGGTARGSDAAARALRALLPDPRGPLRARRRGSDRQRRHGLRAGQLAADRHGLRRRAGVPGGRDDRALRRPAAGAHRGRSLAWRASGALARDNAMRNAARTARPRLR